MNLAPYSCAHSPQHLAPNCPCTHPPSLSAPAAPSFSLHLLPCPFTSRPFTSRSHLCACYFLLPAPSPPLSAWQTPTHSSKFHSRVTSSEKRCPPPTGCWARLLSPLFSPPAPGAFLSPLPEPFWICLPPCHQQSTWGPCHQASALFIAVGLGWHKEILPFVVAVE